MTIDHDYVSALLNIAEKCTGHSGKLSNLQSWAIGELMRVNDEIKAEAVNHRKQAEEEQAAAAQRQAEHEAEAHAQQPEPEPEPDGEPTIFTSDNPNPNLIERGV
jgi:hypothetical protein